MKKRLISLSICLTLLLSLLSGCGAYHSSSEDVSETRQSAMKKASNNYGNADYDAMDFSESDAASVESPSESGNTNENDGIDVEVDTDSKKDQKLVYTCDLTLETLQYEDSVKSVKDLIKKYKGIIEEENQYDDDYGWYNTSSKNSGTLHTSLMIRIPSDHYEDFLEGLEGNGKILHKNMRVDNITKHYTEVSTTIESLKIQEKRLLEMMEKAGSIEDMITVEKRLTEVQNELAQYKNVLAALDTDVAYSTINLTIDEVVRYEAQTNTFMERLHGTLTESGDHFLSFLEGALFALILWGPILLMILIVIVILVMVIRKIRKGRKQKRSRNLVLKNVTAEGTREEMGKEKITDDPLNKDQANEE